MELKDCFQIVNASFKYAHDKTILRDSWNIMGSDYQGDCEDYSLTIMWLHCNKNLLLFLWRIIFSRMYSMHLVCSDGSKDVNHAVGEIGGLFFDNWTQDAFPKQQFIEKTNHKFVSRVNSFVLSCKLVVGLFTK